MSNRMKPSEWKERKFFALYGYPRFQIYALMDPRVCEVRYVGCSSLFIERMACHRRMNTRGIMPKLTAWFKELSSVGCRPIVIPMFSVHHRNYEIADLMAREAELQTILLFDRYNEKHGKHPLLNTRRGVLVPKRLEQTVKRFQRDRQK